MPERLPTRSPFPTFMDAPLVAHDEIREGSIVVSGAAFDTAALGRFGCRYGPNGIRVGSQSLAERVVTAGRAGLIDVDLEQQVFLPSPERLVDVGDVAVYPTDVAKTTESIAAGVATVVKRGGWSIVLGGDHYISYPSVLGFGRAMAERNSRVRLGYIHLDGHLDFSASNAILGRSHNGSHARLASELPMMQRSSMAWIGAAGSMPRSEYEDIVRMGGLILTAEDVHRLGAVEVARRAADHASRGTDTIYLTLDIDILDPGYLPGRSAVDPIGVTPVQLREMLYVLAQYPLGAMDLNEVNPRLDASGRSISLAAEMAMTLIASGKLSTP